MNSIPKWLETIRISISKVMAYRLNFLLQIIGPTLVFFFIKYNLWSSIYQGDRTIIITSHYMADVQALCQRLTLILDGKRGFDGPLTQFEKILGHEKVVSFTFENAIDPLLPLWKGLDPKWNELNNQVELRIPEKELRKISGQIIEQFPVVDFATEKMPIERVMKTLMNNPKLLAEYNA